MTDDPAPRLRLRLVFGDDAMLGPGKVDLLDAIAATGSIAAAGRQMGMSYKRAWMLVDEMNAAFRAPLVQSSRGGRSGGGARLTTLGQTVRGLYHRLLERVADSGAAELQALQALRADRSGGK